MQNTKPYKVYQPSMIEYYVYISSLMSGTEDWRDRKLNEWMDHARVVLE